MAPDLPPDSEWLDRYLAGEGTSDERAAWRRRIGADPELRALVAGIERATGHRHEAATPTWDVNAAWRAAVQQEHGAPVRVPLFRSAGWLASGYRSAWQWGVAIAAVLLVAV